MLEIVLGVVLCAVIFIMAWGPLSDDDCFDM